MKAALFGAALTLALSGNALAHGVGAHVSARPGIVVEIYYADGETMPFAEVAAYAPGSPEAPFAVGRTDREGRFAFAPNAPGNWRIEGRDHEGHKVTLGVPVAQDGAVSKTSKPRDWVLFASLAFNLLGLLAWVEWGRRPARLAQK